MMTNFNQMIDADGVAHEKQRTKKLYLGDKIPAIGWVHLVPTTLPVSRWLLL
jgi:hypothetical protein